MPEEHMPEYQSENGNPKQRRPNTKRQLEAIGELLRVLKPFTPEQRERLLATVKLMLG
jgi:hypothetical protein